MGPAVAGVAAHRAINGEVTTKGLERAIVKHWRDCYKNILTTHTHPSVPMKLRMVVDKLVSDYPYKFVRCQPEYMDCDMSALEKGVLDNMFVDFRRRGSHYEVTTVSSVKDICDRVNNAENK